MLKIAIVLLLIVYSTFAACPAGSATALSCTLGFTLGGTDFDAGSRVLVDSNNNTLVLGVFRNTATFGTQTVTTGAASNDLFVASYTSSGTFNWVATSSGQSTKEVYGFALDSANAVYVSGRFTGTITFNSGTISSTASSYSGFVMKIDSTGTVQWFKLFPTLVSTTTYDYGRMTGLTVDNSGNVVVASAANFKTNGTLSIDGVSITFGGCERFLYIAKLNSSTGTVMEAKTSTCMFGRIVVLNDRFVDLVAANDNKYLITAVGSNLFTLSCGNFGTQAYIIKLNNNFSFNTGLCTQIGTSATYTATIKSITISNDNFYAFGDGLGSFMFSGVTFAAPTRSDLFIVKGTYSTMSVDIVQQIGGNNHDVAYRVRADSAGNIFVASSFDVSTTFITETATVPSGYGFLFAKLFISNQKFVVEWLTSARGSVTAISTNIISSSYGILDYYDIVPSGDSAYSAITTGTLFGSTTIDTISLTSVQTDGFVFAISASCIACASM